MKYYSEVLEKPFNTVEELHAAEKDAKDKDGNRKARAKEVEDAVTAARNARKKADDLIDKFVDDYGVYYDVIREPVSIRSIFDEIFDLF